MQNKFKEWIHDQVWWQQIKTKWEEIDPQTRFSVQWGGVLALAGAILFVVGVAAYRVRNLKSELAEKAVMSSLLQTATDEMKRLKEGLPPTAQTSTESGNWNSYIENLTQQAGIPKGTFTIGPEREAATTDLSKETQLDVTFKQVNIKHVVRFAYQIENASRPMKLRSLLVDTKNDPTGYLEAVFSVSGFGLK